MRTAMLFTALCLSSALPVQASPQEAPPMAPHPDTGAQAPTSHSRIGAIMGSLTQALREAAEQQRQQAHQSATARRDGTPAAASVAQTPTTSLPPDASTQAAVP